jgi:hypothetical protein
MRIRSFIYISIVFLLLIGIATAYVPDRITISLNRDWPIANGIDQVTITAHLYNATNLSAVFPGQTIYFSSIDTTLGKINAASAVTNSVSNATTTFTTLKKSGKAQINVNLWGSPNINDTTYLNIDHGNPYEILTPANYTGEETVGKTINITLKLVDGNGNLIDNKNPNPLNPAFETVDFEVSSPGEGAFFKNLLGGTIGKRQTLTVDPNGTVFAILQIDTVPGDNVVWVRPNSLAPDDYFTVTGMANGVPWYIEQYFPTNETLADGVQLIIFTYTLKDQYKNPLPNKGLNWSARNSSGFELDREQPIFTNQMGWAERTFGPSTEIGPVYMTANPVENKSIWANKTVWFVATDPTDMVLTATPQSMASLDVPSSSSSMILAKVTDAKGNAVKNETVDFTIIPNTPPISEKTAPSFSKVTPLLVANAKTDSNGNAIVYFWPGEFKGSSYPVPEFDEQATANCTISATWTNATLGRSKTRSINLEWKNYPWLSVKSSVTPKLVSVDGTVEVTLQLIGDGWALNPKPIDVALLMDRSGSMTSNSDVKNDAGVAITRLAAAQISARKFVGQMNQSGNKIGLINYNYETSVPIQTALADTSFNYQSPYGSTINNSIMISGSAGATATREGLKQAIDHMNAIPNSNPNAIRAIVLLTDGNWNNAGSPIAAGKGFPVGDGKRAESLTVTNTRGFADGLIYLEDIDYRWYPGLGGTEVPADGTYVTMIKTPREYDGTTGVLVHERATVSKNQILYYTDGQQTEQNMSVYAKNKGLKLYIISFASNIPDSERDVLNNMALSTGGFYQHAATTQQLGDIYTLIAGKLKEDAGINTNIEIDYKDITINSTPFSGAEVFQYIKFTKEKKYWSDNTVIYQNDVLDNTGDWVPPDYTLKFNAGTIKLRQTWQVVYTLKVLKEGNINVFGSNSIIRFNDGATLKLPDTYITAAYNITSPILGNPNLGLSDLQEQVRSDIVREWTWKRNYTGNQTLTEKYYISLDNGQRWIQIGDAEIPKVKDVHVTYGRFVLDLSKIPGAVDAADTIKFRVVASAIDVGSPVRIEQKIQWNHKPDKVYLKLE